MITWSQILIYLTYITLSVVRAQHAQPSRYQHDRRLCYFASWAKFRPGDTKYDISDIDPSLCTHLIYAFGVFSANTRTIDASPGDEATHREFNNLKTRNRNLKTILAIGGQKPEWISDEFEKLTNSTVLVTEFARNVASYLRSLNFDGIDIDWEYPKDKNKFTLLLKSLWEAFYTEARTSGQPALTLQAAVSQNRFIIQKSYNISQIAPYLDLISVMAYDFHGDWHGLAGFNSPLYSRPSNIRFNQDFSQEKAIAFWLAGGAPASKLVLGLATYGRYFRLESRSNHNVGAPIKMNHEDSKIVGYLDICNLLRAGSRYHYDTEQRVPFAYSLDHWVGFDDPRSFMEKTQWMMSKRLGGLMIWTMDYDDFRGTRCGQGKYPLMNAIIKTFMGRESEINLTPPDLILPQPISRTAMPPDVNYKRVCYFTNWSPQWSNPKARYSIDDINHDLCTHIHYAYALIDDVKLSVLPREKTDEVGKNGGKPKFAKFTEMKLQTPSLVTILSIGGGATGSAGFKLASATPSSRTTFAKNVVKYLRDWNFDGVDIVWQFPGDPPETKRQFTQLLTALRDEFLSEYWKLRVPRLQLSAAVSAKWDQINSSYEVKEISSVLDYISVTSYMYDRPENRSALVSPLYPRYDGDPNCQSWSMQYWIDAGAPRDKLLLSLPGFGSSFLLKTITNTGVGDPVHAYQNPSTYIGQAGTMTYYEICEFISGGGEESYDSLQAGMYGYKYHDWVSYDNPITIEQKINWMKEMRLGGFMFWSLDLDDFKGSYCNCGKYPLLTAALYTIHYNRSIVTETICVEPPQTAADATTNGTTYHPMAGITRRTSSGGALRGRLWVMVLIFILMAFIL